MTTPHQSNDGQPDALVVIPHELRRAFVAAVRNPCADRAAGVHLLQDRGEAAEPLGPCQRVDSSGHHDERPDLRLGVRSRVTGRGRLRRNPRPLGDGRAGIGEGLVDGARVFSSGVGGGGGEEVRVAHGNGNEERGQ